MAKDEVQTWMKVSKWTVGLIAAFSMFSFSNVFWAALSGPTLLYLAENSHSSVEQVSSMFTGRSAGYFVGTAAFSFTMNRMKTFQPVTTIGFAVFVAGSLIVTTPWLTNLAGLVIVTTAVGFINGFTDAGTQSLYLQWWGEVDSRPLIQSYHFFGSVGGFVAPIIASPFLKMAHVDNSAEESCPSYDSQEHAMTTTFSYNVTDIPVTSPSSGMNPVGWTYVISGALAFANGICLLFLAFLHVEDHFKTNFQTTSETRKEEPLRTIAWLLLAVLVFYFALGSSLHVYQTYIYTVAVCLEDLSFSVSEALSLNSLFWLGNFLSRLCGIVLSKYYQPSTILAYSLLGVTIGIVPLSIFGSYIKTVIWIATASTGFFLGTLYPSGISWTSKVTNVSTSYILVFNLGNTIGQMVMLPTAGVILELDPFNVIYLVCSTICLLDISFALMLLSRRRMSLENSFFQDSDIDNASSISESISENIKDIVENNRERITFL